MLLLSLLLVLLILVGLALNWSTGDGLCLGSAPTFVCDPSTGREINLALGSVLECGLELGACGHDPTLLLLYW